MEVSGHPRVVQVRVLKGLQAGGLEEAHLVADLPEPVIASLHLTRSADLEAVEEFGDQPVGQAAQADLAVDGHRRRRQTPPFFVTLEVPTAPRETEPCGVHVAVAASFPASRPVAGGDLAGSDTGERPQIRAFEKLLQRQVARS